MGVGCPLQALCLDTLRHLPSYCSTTQGRGLFAGLSIFFSLVYPAWWEQLGAGNLLNTPHLDQLILCPRPTRLVKAWGLEAEKSAQSPWQFFTASSLLALA